MQQLISIMSSNNTPNENDAESTRRDAINAQRRARRASASTAVALARRNNNAQSVAARRAAANPETTSLRRVANARATASSRAAANPDDTHARRVADARNKAASRAAANAGDTNVRRSRNAWTKAVLRSAATTEATVARRDTDVRTTAASRAADYGSIESALRRSRNAQTTAVFRSAATTEVTVARRTDDAERHAAKSAEETLQSRASRLPSSGSSIDMQANPTSDQLQSFERDPIVALLALATNTGLARFRTISSCIAHPHTPDNQDEISAVDMDDHEDLGAGYELRGEQSDSYLSTLIEEIGTGLSEPQMQDVIHDSLLVACASCGVRKYQVF